jgi:phosphoribosyl 1,2-cyclic phosphodiesterase
MINDSKLNMINDSNVEVLLLGAAQDGGFPQFGCKCSNCRLVYDKIIPSDSAVSLAIIDKKTKQWYVFIFDEYYDNWK